MFTGLASKISSWESSSGPGQMDLLLEVTQTGSMVNQTMELLQLTLPWDRYGWLYWYYGDNDNNIRIVWWWDQVMEDGMISCAMDLGNMFVSDQLDYHYQQWHINNKERMISTKLFPLDSLDNFPWYTQTCSVFRVNPSTAPPTSIMDPIHNLLTVQKIVFILTYPSISHMNQVHV